ncbi:hypothetical protein [Candidatus Phycosocius spiralis]|nr:hypothetical protein [Candidatus Phycosocius spiralis]
MAFGSATEGEGKNFHKGPKSLAALVDLDISIKLERIKLVVLALREPEA